MSVIELDDTPDYTESYDPNRRQIENYIRARDRRLSRAKASERNAQRVAFVEAAVVHAIEEAKPDPEFERALAIVAQSVKTMLSPTALGYLDGILTDDERAGAVRWRELARLELWLSRVGMPPSPNAKKFLPLRGFTSQNEYKLAEMRPRPNKLFGLTTRAPGKIGAAIYGIAKRAKVSPSCVIAAVLHFGLERLTQALRESKEVPPVLSREQLDTFPIA